MMPRYPCQLRLLLAAGIVLWAGACTFDGGGVGPLPPGSDLGRDVAADLLSVDLPPPGEPGPTCVDENCPLGCNPRLDRCFRLTASNINVMGFFAVATGTLDLDAPGAEIVIDVDQGIIPGVRDAGDPKVRNGVYWSLLTQKDSSQVAVFAVDTLRISKTTTVRLRGTRPTVFYVRGSVLIDGTLLAVGDQTEPGPGGRRGGAKNALNGESCLGAGRGGEQRDIVGIEWEAGGGGGGHGGAGATGATVGCKGSLIGIVGSPALGGAGGTVWGEESLEPLLGGCGGGAGGGPDVLGERGDGGTGGHGGGAIQISAGKSITVGPRAAINVGGGGGDGGHNGAGGGGGAAGGALLLEAPSLDILGRLVANGGGGGAGSALAFTQNDGEDGAAGQIASVGAEGGKGFSLSIGTSGGTGGAASGPSKPGVDDDLLCNGGGGGGGVGRIRLNANGTPRGATSPPATTGLLKPPW